MGVRMAERFDFDGLRRKQGAALDKITIHLSSNGCYCDCPDGPCEHEFGGWREFEDDCGGEQVCSRCGVGSMAHSMRFAP